MGSSDALQLLQEGNRRFMAGKPIHPVDFSQARFELAENGQRPFAAVLSCSDSRVPPEIVFDQGIGQLFVVRTAGNVADPIAIGSVEYAVQHLHTSLVVVLGHQQCAAVAAAISGGEHGTNIGAILREIQPSVQKTLSEGEEDVAGRCEGENVRHTVSKLRNSRILSQHIGEKKLMVVGAMYDLRTGEVSF